MLPQYSDTPDNDGTDREEPDRLAEEGPVESPVASEATSVAPWYLWTETRHFVTMSLLFSANHGCVVACLSLATARLGGTVGAWQSGLLYATYSISGLVGSTYVVKELGSRDALICGMALYCCYVSAFWLATVVPEWTPVAAALGGIIGGVGAGFLWTAQGAYFSQSARALTQVSSSVTLETMTTRLASLFAVIYLASEVGLRALSSVLLGALHVPWSTIFAIYAVVAVSSTWAMVLVYKFPPDERIMSNVTDHLVANETTATDSEQLLLPHRPELASTIRPSTESVWYKVTAAWQLLRRDRKMPLMIGLNAVFGITSSFVTSYVNGQVVHQVLGSDEYVGLLTAWVSCVAAACSALFGRVATSKGAVLMLGAVCFAAVAAVFVVFPHVTTWHWTRLVWVYTLHGIGRATFEGTLKATFADFFGETDKEGAFANIIFQNGISSTIGFVLTFTLHCTEQQKTSSYCVEYRDGSVHDVLSFEVLIMITAVVAIAGYWRASRIRAEEIMQNRYSDVALHEGDSRRGE